MKKAIENMYSLCGTERIWLGERFWLEIKGDWRILLGITLEQT